MSRGVMPTFGSSSSPHRRASWAWRSSAVLRKRLDAGVYFPSLSSRTLAYKGMLTTELDRFFPDIVDERVESAVALVHSRFSTNTSSWPLAHPFRFIAHNGETDTVMGNRNWMRAREALLTSESAIRADLPDLHPGRERLRVLRRGPRAAGRGRALAAARGASSMIPEAWENFTTRWTRSAGSTSSTADGALGRPRIVVFTDGSQVGAVLDRNGPRYWSRRTASSCSRPRSACSTSTPLPVTARAGSTQGHMYIADVDEHRIIEDEEIKGQL